MAAIIFELGRYITFLGVFFYLAFGISFFLFRKALDRLGLSLSEPEVSKDGPVERGAVDMAQTVHFLRKRAYDTGSVAIQTLGRQYRAFILWPFYLGVWCFCTGLALMSATFGFVIFE